MPKQWFAFQSDMTLVSGRKWRRQELGIIIIRLVPCKKREFSFSTGIVATECWWAFAGTPPLCVWRIYSKKNDFHQMAPVSGHEVHALYEYVRPTDIQERFIRERVINCKYSMSQEILVNRIYRKCLWRRLKGLNTISFRLCLGNEKLNAKFMSFFSFSCQIRIWIINVIY